MQIRNDFRGAVIVHTKAGAVLLRAGDTVPQGARIDAGLVEAQPKQAAKKTTAKKPAAKKAAGKEVEG